MAVYNTENKEERKKRKARAKLEKMERAFHQESKKETDIIEQNKITFICVKFGNKYGKEYLEKLKNMIIRHTTIDHEIVCLTDDNHYYSGIKSIKIEPNKYSKLWWYKVHMFDPELDLSGRLLYFDLDVVIHNSIDKLVQNIGNKFYGIRDFNRKFYPKWQGLNSSAMTWVHGSASEIFLEFQKNPQQAMRLHGDQDWIYKILRSKINFWPDTWVQSYKWEIRSREELVSRLGSRGFKNVRNNVEPHTDCCVAVFHGQPNPEDVMDSFVIDNWR